MLSISTPRFTPASGFGREFSPGHQGQSAPLSEELRLFFREPPVDCRGWREMTSMEKGHGRVERCHLSVAPELNGFLATHWPGVAQVFVFYRRVSEALFCIREWVSGFARSRILNGCLLALFDWPGVSNVAAQMPRFAQPIFSRLSACAPVPERTLNSPASARRFIGSKGKILYNTVCPFGEKKMSERGEVICLGEERDTAIKIWKEQIQTCHICLKHPY